MDLEENLLNNVDINFMFARGDGLRNQLIDLDRTFKLVNKLEESQHKYILKQKLKIKKREQYEKVKKEFNEDPANSRPVEETMRDLNSNSDLKEEITN